MDFWIKINPIIIFISFIYGLVSSGCFNKLPWTECLNTKLFFTVLECGNPNIRVPTWFGSGGSPLADFLCSL